MVRLKMSQSDASWNMNTGHALYLVNKLNQSLTTIPRIHTKATVSMMDLGALPKYHRHLLSQVPVNELREAQTVRAKARDSGLDATTAQRVPVSMANVNNPPTAPVLAVLPTSPREPSVARGHQLLRIQVGTAEGTTLNHAKYAPIVSRKVTRRETLKLQHYDASSTHVQSLTFASNMEWNVIIAKTRFAFII